MNEQSPMARLCDRATRIRTLEAVVLAHLIMNPALFPATAIRLSDAAAALLDVLYREPGSRCAFVEYTNLALQWEPVELRADAIALAEQAMVFTVAELAAIGTFDQVLDLLDSIRDEPALVGTRSRRAA